MYFFIPFLWMVIQNGEGQIYNYFQAISLFVKQANIGIFEKLNTSFMKKTYLIIALFLNVFAAFGQPTAGLIAYWDMNGSTNDVSGNGNNGTGSSITPAIGEDGIMGHAYFFNGVNSSIPVPLLTQGLISLNLQFLLR